MLRKLKEVLTLNVNVDQGWLGKRFIYSNGWTIWRNDSHPLLSFDSNKVHGMAEPGLNAIAVNMTAIKDNKIKEQYIEQHELAHVLLAKMGDWSQRNNLPYVIREIFPDVYAAVKTGVFFKRGKLINTLVLITIKLLGYKTPICYDKGA
jgi:hypothetical protein